MENISFESILIISLLAFITPIIISTFKKIKIPYVVGEIFVGLIVGKSFLNIVHDDLWIVFLSNLGLAYLLFLSGLEIDIDDLTPKEGDRRGLKNIFVCIIMFLSSILVSFIISKILSGFNLINNVGFFTFLFASSAPGLLVPFLKERELLDTEYGQILLIFSLIGEFICLIAMTILSSTASGNLSYENFLFIIVLLASFLLYIISKKFFKIFDFSKAAFKNLHIEVRAAFALILVLVSVSHVVRSEIVLGSFLAGLIFALLFRREKEDLKFKLDIIGYGFLIPIFFIEVGVNLDVSSVLQDYNTLLMIPILLLIFFVVKLVPSLIFGFFYGFDKTLSSSFILSSQLSLMIVGSQIAYNIKIIDASTYSLFIITTVISALLFPIFFDKSFKAEGITKKKKRNIDKICIRETVVTNEQILNKPLKDISFPKNCRVFMIIRDEKEIIPNGETVLMLGDIVILAGIKDHEEDMLKVVNNNF
ncbi:cation:proton antiporter [Clostridium tetanomorphum]|uniref:cation:proton antiporter n=1 Tax=Clostridium tetanomorphum TaxID=1553 RepID=UPI00156DBE3C|nr:cation:proton antiporter [Clostridium tetanomorphum]NRZ98336.1 trk system potassium uptake protein TrkA [Clostridium tetanomorphum]